MPGSAQEERYRFKGIGVVFDQQDLEAASRLGRLGH